MKSKTLKVISINSDNVDELLVNGTYAYTNCVYLHGIVEHAIGYDIVLCMNPEDFKKLPYYDNCIKIDINDGIYHCEVDGYAGECTAYIWHRNIFGNGSENVGLIVDATDKTAVQYAEEKYKEKSSII